MNSTFTRMSHAIDTLSKEQEYNRERREEIIEKFMNHKGFVTQAVREHCPDLENKMETCWTEYGKGK